MLISVIVPIYNVEKYLHRCVDSILCQTFTDFELILVDDGSSDHCGEICDEYANKDVRIVVIHKKNGGLSDARNAGLDWVFSNSNSEWITFIDSDDWVQNRYLELLYKAVKDYRVNVSSCKYVECSEPISDNNNSKPQIAIFSGEEFCLQEYRYSHTAWGRLYKKEYWLNLRFPFGKLHEDAFTIYTILLPEESVAFVSEPCLYCFFSENNTSITRSKWTPRRLDLIEALEKKIRYSKENHYLDYYYLQIKEYIGTCRWFIDCAKETNNDNVIPFLRRKLRRALRYGRKEKVFCFCKKNIWIYEIAYPTQMKYYWYWQVFKRKIKRK